VVRTKSLGDAVEPGDGRRIFISLYRPRGLAKEAESWHAWEKRLAPSRALFDAFRGRARSGGRVVARGLPGLAWSDYEKRFREEMRAPEAQAALDDLAGISACGQTITLLCHCADERRCHRAVVRELVAAKERALRGG
jgi:uncharacterized protein YeaO (DUF488 family)